MISAANPAALSPDAAFQTAAKTILCDCGCHPQSVFDCACERAAEMRAEIRARADRGESGVQIIAAYVAKYGEKIRVAPTSHGFNAVAWIAPGGGIVFAGLLIALLLKRWNRKHLGVPSAPPPSLPASDPYAERLAKEMREYDR